MQQTHGGKDPLQSKGGTEKQNKCNLLYRARVFKGSKESSSPNLELSSLKADRMVDWYQSLCDMSSSSLKLGESIHHQGPTGGRKRFQAFVSNLWRKKPAILDIHHHYYLAMAPSVHLQGMSNSWSLRCKAKLFTRQHLRPPAEICVLATGQPPDVSINVLENVSNCNLVLLCKPDNQLIQKITQLNLGSE